MDGTGFSAQMLRANLIRFASLLFNKMSNKYGADTTLNELVIMNYGFVCHVRGEDIRVTKTATDLGIPTVYGVTDSHWHESQRVHLRVPASN